MTKHMEHKNNFPYERVLTGNSQAFVPGQVPQTPKTPRTPRHSDTKTPRTPTRNGDIKTPKTPTRESPGTPGTSLRYPSPKKLAEKINHADAGQGDGKNGTYSDRRGVVNRKRQKDKQKLEWHGEKLDCVCGRGRLDIMRVSWLFAGHGFVFVVPISI